MEWRHRVNLHGNPKTLSVNMLPAWSRQHTQDSGTHRCTREQTLGVQGAGRQAGRQAGGQAGRPRAGCLVQQEGSTAPWHNTALLRATQHSPWFRLPASSALRDTRRRTVRLLAPDGMR